MKFTTNLSRPASIILLLVYKNRLNSLLDARPKSIEIAFDKIYASKIIYADAWLNQMTKTNLSEVTRENKFL